jgi:two-component system sensor histidine kinase/response regulator
MRTPDRADERHGNAHGVRAKKKGLELRTHIVDDVEQLLIGDSMQLRQILLNFADNALKFTEHGSVVVQVVRLLDFPSCRGL